MHRGKIFRRLLIIIALYSVFITGCDEQSASNEASGSSALSAENEQMGEKLPWWRAKWQSRELKLQKENERLKSELSQRDDQYKIAQRELAESKRKHQHADKVIKISLIAGGSVLAIGFLLIAYLICRKPKNKGNDSPNDINRCPRCGWERTPGESICRNCKTQF